MTSVSASHNSGNSNCWLNLKLVGTASLLSGGKAGIQIREQTPLRHQHEPVEASHGGGMRIDVTRQSVRKDRDCSNARPCPSQRFRSFHPVNPARQSAKSE